MEIRLAGSYFVCLCLGKPEAAAGQMNPPHTHRTRATTSPPPPLSTSPPHTSPLGCKGWCPQVSPQKNPRPPAASRATNGRSEVVRSSRREGKSACATRPRGNTPTSSRPHHTTHGPPPIVPGEQAPQEGVEPHVNCVLSAGHGGMLASLRSIAGILTCDLMHMIVTKPIMR